MLIPNNSQLATLSPYKKLQSLLDAESLEPALGWGLRMAIATTVPVIWGIATGHEQQAEWIALTADCICWVALKGTYAQRLRVLAGGMVLALLSGLLGSISGSSLLLSLLLMLVISFVAGLFKNLGDRGSGLSLCLYVMFLIPNAHPVFGVALGNRLLWIMTGAVWNTLLAILAFLFMPVQQPYRRGIALIWKAAAGLAASVAKGWDGREVRSSARAVYLREKDVRTAIDSSFLFHEQMAHQVAKSGKASQEYQLAQVRKTAALVAAHVSAIHDEVEMLTLKSLDTSLRGCIYDVLKSLQNCTERASYYILSLRGEDQLLLQGRLDRLRNGITQLQEYKGAQSLETVKIVRRILQLANRTLRLIEHSITTLEGLAEQPVYRSYSLIKTALVLHPAHWLRNMRLLFNIDTHTFRYALRTALAATFALFCYKALHIEHGYWLPFSVIIVLQPYFGATLKKALDRVAGTLAGGLAGGLLILLPAGLHIKEVMFFGSAIAMVYFFRRRYSVSAFFITLNLVLLFAVSEGLSESLIITRALTTISGAIIAVAAGFLLLPTWDKKYLPRHIRAALRCNWEYFSNAIIMPAMTTPWTKYKRAAETANSNAFDSFNRFMQEYHRDSKATYRIFYNLITHNVRLTREINNLLLEHEETGHSDITEGSNARQASLLAECDEIFARLMSRLGEAATVAASVPGVAYSEIYLERLLTELKALAAALAVMPES